MEINIKTKGLKKLERYLLKLNRFLNNSEKAWKKAGIIGLRDIDNHFRKSQGSKGKWEALKFRQGKPLLKTRRLEGSIEFVSGPKGVIWGTNLKYARWHQDGTSKIPQREFLWLSNDAANKILNMFLNEMKNP